MNERFFNTPARTGLRFPGRIVAERGALPDFLNAEPREGLLILADRAVAAHPALRLAGGADAIIVREPYDTDIDALDDMFAGRKPTAVLAVGGGSAIDAAKALVMRRRHGASPSRDLPRGSNAPRLVAAPTTAGSGSETSRFHVLTRHDDGTKLSWRSWDAVPDLTLLDPALLEGAPPALLAQGAFDACLHLWETHVARGEASAFTDALARDFIPRILAQLPELSRGKAPAAAGLLDLMQASAMAGIAISNVRTGAIHTLGEALSAQIDLPHPLTLRVFAASVIESYASATTDRLAILWAVANARAPLRGPWCARVFLAAWDEVFARLGLDRRIAEALDTTPPSLDRLCEVASRDTVLSKENPVPLPPEALRVIAARGIASFRAPAFRSAVNAR